LYRHTQGLKQVSFAEYCNARFFGNFAGSYYSYRNAVLFDGFTKVGGYIVSGSVIVKNINFDNGFKENFKLMFGHSNQVYAKITEVGISFYTFDEYGDGKQGGQFDMYWSVLGFKGDGLYKIAFDDIVKKQQQTQQIEGKSKLYKFAEAADDWANSWGPNVAKFILNVNPFYTFINSGKTMISAKDIMGNEKKGFGQRVISPSISVAMIFLPLGTPSDQIVAQPMMYFMNDTQQKVSENIYNDNH